jgi:hypothetical protein
METKISGYGKCISYNPSGRISGICYEQNERIDIWSAIKDGQDVMRSGSVVSMEPERTSVYVHELGINEQKSNFTHDPYDQQLHWWGPEYIARQLHMLLTIYFPV